MGIQGMVDTFSTLPKNIHHQCHGALPKSTHHHFKTTHYRDEGKTENTPIFSYCVVEALGNEKHH